MLDWLLSPIDPSRMHDVGFAVSWHGRLMVIAWGGLAPLAVIVARFFKIVPGQDWPNVLDNTFWWRSHWMAQTAVLALTCLGVALIQFSGRGPTSLHGWLGYLIMGLVILQAALGVFRGSKGGPTSLAPDGTPRGDHYDMTPWRRHFEWLHKSLGYACLGLAAATILLGMWAANAPVWMWLALAFWWPALILVFIILQRRGLAVDTYQAIWGPGQEHPGNQLPKPGWGVTRRSE